MAKKKKEDLTNSVAVDPKIIKMMYEDYSTALIWAEYLEGNFSHVIGFENRRKLDRHIAYLRKRKEEFWSKI